MRGMGRQANRARSCHLRFDYVDTYVVIHVNRQIGL